MAGIQTCDRESQVQKSCTHGVLARCPVQHSFLIKYYKLINFPSLVEWSGTHPPAGRGLEVVSAARGLNKSATVQHRQFIANGPTPQLGVMRQDRRYGSLLPKRFEGRKDQLSALSANYCTMSASGMSMYLTSTGRFLELTEQTAREWLLCCLRIFYILTSSKTFDIS